MEMRQMNAMRAEIAKTYQHIEAATYHLELVSINKMFVYKYAL